MSGIRDVKVNFSKLSGRDQLLFHSLTAADGLSQLFELNLEVLSENDMIDLETVLGQEMSVSVEPTLGPARFFHGYVTSFSYIGTVGTYASYRAVLRPHLWKLTRTSESRVFQKQTVPDIVLELLKTKHGIVHLETDFGHENRGAYLPWDYCVQYRETDFNFVARLLEYEGIHYFFKHEVDKHVLVLTDSLARHATVPGYEAVPFRRATNDESVDEGLWSWNATRVVLPGTHATSDFDFTIPTAKLYRSSGSDVERKHAKGMTPDYEIYDQPEPVVQQTGYAPARVEDYARMRIEELHAQYEVISADCNARGLYAGALFKVVDGPRKEIGDTKYLVIESDFYMQMDNYRSGGTASEGTFKGKIRAINSKHHFRPPRVSHKPLIQGLQSATVVGTSGEKVDTDKYGRVRVQFHWDRDGKNNEKSSCWLRVSQNWAGANWGGMFLPHIGQEVLVGFMEGDPDRPIVVGRVYNGMNMPPLKLPDNKLKSIIRDHFGNEIVMDGTPGNESMSFHSPSHHSVLQLGKSVRTFSHSKQASCTYDSESYNFGMKISYTKGISFSVDRGVWLGIKAGNGASVTVGSELSVSGGAKLSVTVGGAISISASWSCAWGYARELKFTKGSYKRSSTSDVLLDSQKTVFITGGKNDNTMMESNDELLALTFDDSNSNRAADMAGADAKVKAYTVAAAAAVAVGSTLGFYGYARNVAKKGPVKDVDAKTESIEMDYENISKVGVSDLGAASAVAFGGTIAITGFPGQSLDNPKHPSPSSKVLVKKDLLRLFAGKDEESLIVMEKDAGVNIAGKKNVDIASSDGGITIDAQKEVKLKSSDAVNVDAMFKHKNMTILQ